MVKWANEMAMEQLTRQEKREKIGNVAYTYVE